MATNGHTNGADAGKQSFNVKVSLHLASTALPHTFVTRFLTILQFDFRCANDSIQAGLAS